MKPAAFKYLAPASLEAALEAKSENGEDAKILAGGQSLVPAMNFRVTQSKILLDLNKIEELGYIREQNGNLLIGAMTRQSEVESSKIVAMKSPLISETMPHIAHPQIRNRGTFGGNLAHADPASELPVVATALNARYLAKSSLGERWIDAKDFFLGFFTVSLTPEEILTEIKIPDLPPNTGWSFMEITRRKGDYAMAGIAALVTIDKTKKCKQARLVFLNVGDGPIDAEKAAEELKGQKISDESIEAAAETASEKEINPFGSVHATPEYQRHLTRVLTRRAIKKAFERAQSVKSKKT